MHWDDHISSQSTFRNIMVLNNDLKLSIASPCWGVDYDFYSLKKGFKWDSNDAASYAAMP